MKQQINALIGKIRSLQSLESTLSIIQYSLQDSKQEDDLAKISQTILLIQIINKKLSNNILSFLSSKEPTECSFATIEQDMLKILENVKTTSTNSIPHKTELLELLASLQNALSEKNIVTVLDFLKKNKSEHQNQLFTLEEICAQEF